MPTYSYACTECDNRFDVVQSFTDQSLTVCPRCEGRLRKLFNSVGIVFKGSGFYRTDSRPGEKADVPAGKESGAKDSGGGDSSGGDKPAPAKESPKKESPKKDAPAAKGSSSTSGTGSSTS
ncbi:zinc ribbon domain-containing protein [Rhodococcus aerolatus]